METTNRQNSKEEKKSFSQVLKDAFKELKETSIAFVKAPKALWGVNVPYVLEGLVYFGVLTILGKYSSEHINLNDAQACLVYSFLTGGITFAMLVLGGLSDKLGVRKSLIISFLVLILGRLLVAVSGSFGMQSGLWSPMFITMTTGLFFVMIAYGLYQPAAYAAVKRYTTPKTAAMGYAAIYGFMNLGAFFSGFISSLTRPHFIDTFPPNGLTSVFWVYVMITFIALVLTLMLITKKSDKDAVDVVKAAGNEGEEKEEDKSKEKIKNTKLIVLGILMVASFLLSGFGIKNPINFIFSFSLLGFSITIDFFFTIAIILFAITVFEYLRRRPYHPFRDKRFTFFIFVLIPVQTLFAHNWLTLPYYLDRAFQGSVVSEYFEIFSNLNPILVFLFAPIVAGLTAKADVYKMMIYGTFVMAIPTFLLVLGPNMYLFLLYILIMTIGESMWQPRFLQWIAEVAPKGMVGLYMGVGQFPWFLTKVLTGFYSGWFLMKYVPLGVSPTEMSTETMWFFYGLIAIISPIGLVLAKKWVMKDFKVKAEV